MVAVFLRTLARFGNWTQQEPLHLVMTVDLRRYLPRGGSIPICNLSSFEFLMIKDLGQRFADTVERVVRFTRERKQDWLCLTSYALSIPVAKVLPYRWLQRVLVSLLQGAMERGNSFHGITNLGVICPEDVTFDEPPQHASIQPPILFPPLFEIAFSTYRGAMTVSAGLCPECLVDICVEDFFDALILELKG
jgi:NRPS condensation-like uncharacterized protein